MNRIMGKANSLLRKAVTLTLKCVTHCVLLTSFTALRAAHFVHCTACCSLCSLLFELLTPPWNHLEQPQATGPRALALLERPLALDRPQGSLAALVLFVGRR